MDTTLDRAWLLMGSNRFDRSEQEIRKHLSENPDDARAHTMLAMCLFDLSLHDDAIESGKKAIELVPENPYPYWVLACIYIRLQQLDSAEEYLFEAIDLNPEYPDFHASLSELYWMRGRSRELPHEQKKDFLDKGSEAARTGLEIEANHFNSKLYLIKNLLALDDDNCIIEAIDLAEELLSLDPESAEAHEVYAQALCCKSRKIKYTKQDLNRILSILQESLRLDPNRPYAKFLACHLLEWHYSILSIKEAWLITFLKFVNIAAIPLLSLTLYFYNVNGFQIYSTGVFALLTLISLIPIIDLTQAQLRIYFNIQYRKFSQSDKAIDLFRWIIAIIAIIGLSWQYLPVFVIKILTLILWFCLPVVVIVLLFSLRRLIKK
ncbi:tetratricopeptide repeat protein [Chamaesiphon sp. OTE_20_metabat_361]|uniref:tetratricopeptide repeat protein n=1 Tax=Chamaesiphon sp. OTE_20_metabat_361 TaxID=2964689 RepID=UPI00286A3513|nr:tetratricopeptide repeat protein [Chamaesiphon sp. OTE_20_metabat_361]